MTVKIASALVALLAFMAPGAAAADRANPRKVASARDVVAGPVVAGSHVLYATAKADGPTYLWRDAKRIKRLSGDHAQVALAASAHALAVSIDGEAYAGRTGKALKHLPSHCDGVAPGSSPVSVSGYLVAWIDCRPQRGHAAYVRDLLGGLQTAPYPVAGRSVHVAGNYLAYLAPDDPTLFLIHNLTTTATYGVRSSAVDGWDLDEAGRVALTVPAPSSSDSASWYSFDDQSAHYLSQCGGDDIAIDSGRIVCVGNGGLLVYPLDGGEPVHFGARLAGPVDLSGPRLAFAVSGCAGTTGGLWLADLRRPLTGSASPTACTAAILSARARLDSRGRLPVRVRCARVCRGTLTIDTPDGTSSYGSNDFYIPAGKTVTVRVASDSLEAALERRRSITVRASTAASGGDASRDIVVTR
jgi:hypothetical protein